MKRTLKLFRLTIIILLVTGYNTLLSQEQSSNIKSISYNESQIKTQFGIELVKEIQFKDRKRVLKTNEDFNISPNGKFVGIRENYKTQDQKVKVQILDSSGELVTQLWVLNSGAGFEISDIGGFILFGPKPNLTYVDSDTTSISYYDKKGEMFLCQNQLGGSYKKGFSETGNTFVYLASSFDCVGITVYILTNLQETPGIKKVYLPDWPTRPSLFVYALIIDETSSEIDVFYYSNHEKVDIIKLDFDGNIINLY